MGNYDFLTKDVINGIKKSNEYHHYHRLLKKVMQDDELYDTINEYRKKLFSLQMMEGEDIDAYQIMMNLRQEYEYLLENSLVNEFLIAEQKLSKMGKEIVAIIIESLDLDIDFIDGE